MKRKLYVDVGHQNLDEALVWLYEPPLVAIPARSATHEEIWGQTALNHWRGRYDGKTNELSIIPPITWPEFYGIPDELTKILESRFGDYTEAAFNPKGTPRKARKRRKPGK